MTTRTVLLGGSDWSDGNVLYSADLNDTFDALTNRGEYTEIVTNGTTAATDWTTIDTIDVSGETDLYGYRLFYHLYKYITAGGTTIGSYQMIVTFDDASTTTINLGTITSDISNGYFVLTIDSVTYTKRIETVTLQAKTSDGGENAGYATNLNDNSGAGVGVLSASYVTIK